MAVLLKIANQEPCIHEGYSLIFDPLRAANQAGFRQTPDGKSSHHIFLLSKYLFAQLQNHLLGILHLWIH
jgi:hypothetical protein